MYSGKIFTAKQDTIFQLSQYNLLNSKLFNRTQIIRHKIDKIKNNYTLYYRNINCIQAVITQIIIF